MNMEKAVSGKQLNIVAARHTDCGKLNKNIRHQIDMALLLKEI